MGLMVSMLRDILGGKKRKESVQVMLPDGFNALRQCRNGPMLYNRHDIYVGGSLEKYGEFSTSEVDFFRSLLHPGMYVVEVGANIGTHTVELSHLVGHAGRVYTFEPQRLVFQNLCANLALGQCDNVFAYQMAVGDKAGEIVVPAVSYESRNNFGGISLLGHNSLGETVSLATLDSFNLPRCDFIKADVEGMECEVLRGAQKTIAKFRPALYVENDRKERSAELIALVQSLGYRAWWHLPPLYSPSNFAGTEENIFPDIVSINMYCLPHEADCSQVKMREVKDPSDDWQSSK